MSDLPTVSRWEVIRNRKRILRNPLPFHKENFEKFGDSFRVKIASPSGIIFTRDPEVIQHVLQKNHKNYQKSKLQTEDLAKYIGHGLLTSNGEHWRVHRRMIQPAFHKKKLEGLLTIMDRAIEGELNTIKPGKETDVFPMMSDLAFQVVAQSLFSRADIRKRMVRLQNITESNQRMLIREMRQPYLNWWFHLSGKIDKHLAMAGQGREILNGIIEERVESGQQKDDLLDMLLEARYEDGTPMSREQLLDEVLILFTAGHETTANALSFSLFNIARNESVQQKLRKEVAAAEHASVGFPDLFKNLPYTKCCIEESLRLYPPAYVIDREAIGHDSINGLELRKGSLVLMSVYELHRHSEFWKDALKFHPERFQRSLPKDYARYYYPFGAGPRMCVGNNFAMYEMILTLYRILSRYRISTNLAEIEINPLISLKPKRAPICFEQI